MRVCSILKFYEFVSNLGVFPCVFSALLWSVWVIFSHVHLDVNLKSTPAAFFFSLGHVLKISTSIGDILPGWASFFPWVFSPDGLPSRRRRWGRDSAWSVTSLIIEGAISSPGPSPWRFPKWRLYAFKHFGRRGRRGRGTTPWNCRVWSTQWPDQSSNPCQRANRLSTSPLVRCELSLHQTSFSNHFISYLLLQSTVVESLNPFLRFLRGGFTGKSRPRRRFISPVL